MNPSQDQKGFTLIELIVVVVILGILAATALPKFIDVKGDAEAAAIKGVAGGVSSAFAVNYAGVMVHSSKGTPVTGAAMDAASVGSILGSIMAGGMPTGYSIAAQTVTCGTAGNAVTITVTNASHAATNQAATATLICTG